MSPLCPHQENYKPTKMTDEELEPPTIEVEEIQIVAVGTIAGVEAIVVVGLTTVLTNGIKADGPNTDGATQIKMTGTSTLQRTTP